jgi:hypothetical protein
VWVLFLQQRENFLRHYDRSNIQQICPIGQPIAGATLMLQGNFLGRMNVLEIASAVDWNRLPAANIGLTPRL